MMRRVFKILALLLLIGVLGGMLWLKLTEPSGDPAAARIITDDVSRFWAAYDRATPENLATVLQTDYLDPGTPGLEAFILYRIRSAEALARAIETHPQYYASARESTLRLAAFEPEIRVAFHRFKALYPEAVFPDVYFVIGRLTSGGTANRNALIVGAEMYGRTDDFPAEEFGNWHRAVLAPPERVPALVAHELVHYQQRFSLGRSSLLAASIREGTADFVAELIAGEHINPHVHAWANPREALLWEEFQTRMHKDDYDDWLFDPDTPDGRPADLGYWMGYRIVASFFAQTTDTTAALREILRIRDAEDFLTQSRYGPSITP